MITAVTTCMGRREHLEMTLPLMLDTFDKVIVVDWSCPQKSGEFASEQGASVIYKYGEQYFERTKARNLGASHVTTEYIAFIDADGFCFPGMREALKELLGPSRMVLAPRDASGSDITDTFGFLACPLQSFVDVGCYDESFIGWGHEDSKLRCQLLLEGKLEPVRLPPKHIGAIRHDMTLRSQNLQCPLQMSAGPNWRRLYEYCSQFGIKDWMTDPRTESITFKWPKILK